MPNRADCYIAIFTKNAGAFAPQFLSRMVELYGSDNVSQRAGAVDDLVLFEVFPPHEPITPDQMVGWFSARDLRSVIITCKWVNLTGDLNHGRWTMDSSGVTREDFYEREDDQVENDEGDLAPSGRLLTFLKEHTLDSIYV
jgi:hypothetical protein